MSSSNPWWVPSIGTLVFAKKSSGVCERGELGIVVGHYNREHWDGGAVDPLGVDVYFPTSDKKDGFSGAERETFLIPALTQPHVNSVQKCMLIQMERYWEHWAQAGTALDARIVERALSNYYLIYATSIPNGSVLTDPLNLMRVSNQSKLASLTELMSFEESEKSLLEQVVESSPKTLKDDKFPLSL